MLFQHLQSQYLGRVLGGIYTLMYQNSKMIAGMMIEVLKGEVNHVRRFEMVGGGLGMAWPNGWAGLGKWLGGRD